MPLWVVGTIALVAALGILGGFAIWHAVNSSRKADADWLSKYTDEAAEGDSCEP